MERSMSLPKMNVFLLIVLSSVTLAIYIPVWFLRRRDWLNSLSTTEKLGSVLPIVVLVIYCISLLLLLFMPDETLSDTIDSLISLIGGIITLVLAFSVRRILIEHFKDKLGMNISFSGVATFFFTIWYLQYKINRLDRVEVLTDTLTPPIHQ